MDIIDKILVISCIDYTSEVENNQDVDLQEIVMGNINKFMTSNELRDAYSMFDINTTDICNDIVNMIMNRLTDKTKKEIIGKTR